MNSCCMFYTCGKNLASSAMTMLPALFSLEDLNHKYSLNLLGFEEPQGPLAYIKNESVIKITWQMMCYITNFKCPHF